MPYATRGESTFACRPSATTAPHFLFDRTNDFGYFFGGVAGTVATSKAGLSGDFSDEHEKRVAWAVERADGGRASAFTGGHFFAHWENESFRRLMVNAILWTAKAEVRFAWSAASNP
jgi:hypothetical protein